MGSPIEIMLVYSDPELSITAEQVWLEWTTKMGGPPWSAVTRAHHPEYPHAFKVRWVSYRREDARPF